MNRERQIEFMDKAEKRLAERFNRMIDNPEVLAFMASYDHVAAPRKLKAGCR